ncbi:MAG: RsbRD N-terminal domain-containing protein [Nitrospiraceae bacterium]|jgi:hypothetical protein|nr:MAG: RsbRD N-terminal domain-containing protein [Nitrospiraceae bacterium]
MTLRDSLSERKENIIEKWFERIIDTYPPDTSRFLKDQKDRFANPVGATISRGLEGIFEEILKDEQDQAKVSKFIDNIVRIRAVQNFNPSQAISFIFLLKNIIRDELTVDVLHNHNADELLALESQIDGLALTAFDIFMNCREKIYEIKSNEAKDMTFRLLQRANLLKEKQNHVADDMNDVTQ